MIAEEEALMTERFLVWQKAQGLLQEETEREK